MKKIVVLFVAALTFGVNVSANDNYPDDDIITSPTKVSSGSSESAGYYGLGFFSYDGAENYGLSFGGYYYNWLGFGLNLRSNWKFSDHQNTYNADFLLNFSIGVYSDPNNELMFLITPEIGPSLGMRDIYDNGKFKEKYYCDGFAGIKATVVYKKLVLSAGYHIWAPKWKFGKNEKADGFYAQLGINF